MWCRSTSDRCRQQLAVVLRRTGLTAPPCPLPNFRVTSRLRAPPFLVGAGGRKAKSV